MKKNPAFVFLAIFFAALILASGCKKKSEEPVVTGPVPVVVTGSHSKLLLNTVHFSGSITSDGGVFVTKRGFCWSSTNQNPAIQHDTMIFGNGAGSFSGDIKGLTGQTTYYVRAFATNNNGTGYGSIMSIRTIDTTVTDTRDGQVYPAIQIGSQCWLQKNMNYRTEYSWCYDNNSSNGVTYGRLYDWQRATKVCPSGWHLPSDGEWTALTDFLGGTSVAGGKMKEAGTAHWLSPNKGATNSSGFTALPGGQRWENGGDRFGWLTTAAGFWSTLESSSGASLQMLSNDGTSVVCLSVGSSTTDGFSVRCIRD